MNDAMMPKGVQLIQLPQNVDERGRLSYVEECVHIPFAIKRVFWISDVPEGQMRGGHAHWTCHEVVFPVAGSFEIEVDDGTCARTFKMEDSSCGILIPAGVWCELSHFRPGTVCVVMASQEYDVSGYANEKEAWRKVVNRK